MAEANWTDRRMDVAFALTRHFPEHFRLWKAESMDVLQAKFEAPNPNGWPYLWHPFARLDAVVEGEPHPVSPFAFERVLAPLLRAAAHHGIGVDIGAADAGVQVSARLPGRAEPHHATGPHPGELLAYALIDLLEAPDA